MHDEFIIAGKKIKSRFFLGTGKFKNKQDLKNAVKESQTEVVTVAMRRIDIQKNEDNIISYLPDGITLMTNTSGARNAAEAVRIARLARESGLSNWIKIEVIGDNKYLLPDNLETVKAVEILAADGFVVLPYMHPDLYAARDMVKAGASAVMPLGSLIGSNRGLEMGMMIEILIREIDVPVVVDAGIGAPSHAAEAMEMGADAVLVNTAVAVSKDPAMMAKAFAKSIEAGRIAYLAGLGEKSSEAKASSPLTGFLYNE